MAAEFWEADPADAALPELDPSPADDESQAVEAAVTGDAAVDDALRRLASVVSLSLEDQLPALDTVHRTLQDRLADVDG